MTPKAIDVKPLSNFEIEVTFENGEKKVFDVKPYFKYSIFKKLQENDNFKKVKVSGLSIEWENGADICPDELYKLSR